MGLLWWFIGIVPLIFFRASAASRPIWYGGLTTGEWHAWAVLMYAFGSIFGALGTFWLLAYIKRDDRLFQKMYYRAIAWVIPISWVLALWEFIAFLIGGTQLGGDIGMDMVYAFVWWVLLGGLEGLAWYLAPRTVKFYKWDQQDWWNYDGVDTWPEQLGDFVNEM